MITQKQLNIIANCVCTDSSGESRSAKAEMAIRLFPEDMNAIQTAIINHPIEQNWDEYVKCPWEERSKYLLPEA